MKARRPPARRLAVQRGYGEAGSFCSTNSREMPKWQSPGFSVILRNPRCTVKDWQKAAEFDSGQMRPYFQLQQSEFLARAGDHRAAVKYLEELLETSNEKDHIPFSLMEAYRGALKVSSDPISGKTLTSGLPLFNVACVYALSSAAAKDDANLREQFAARAVALLCQAQTSGFFKDPKRVEQLRRETDLDALRQRDDYKKFVAELSASGRKLEATENLKKDTKK